MSIGVLNKKQIKSTLLKDLESKAKQSPSTFSVAAAAYSKNGNLLGLSVNGFKRLHTAMRRGAGFHAEHKLILQFGKKIDTIYIIRIGKNGDRLPIHPCGNCAKIADKLGIKIISLHETFGYVPTEIYP